MNQQTLKGHWNEIKGKITEKWGAVTENDLKRAEGNTDQLVGIIQQKTGESREAINEFINSLTNGSSLEAVVENARQYAASAAETVQETAMQAAEQVKAGYEQTEKLVKSHPLESLAVCFGVGVLTGVVAGLILRSK
jgi:uncharacterized protein YjbJ (UPF0337 family)